MTASPTPPPAGQFGPIREALEMGLIIHWADDTVRDILAALDAAERRVAELEAERVRVNLTWNDAFNWLYVALTNRLADLAAARQQNETLLGCLEHEREQHREMYERQAYAVRIHTDQADAAERRAAELERERNEALTQRADFEIGLTLAQDDLAAAGRHAAELTQEHADYEEHSDASHRVMAQLLEDADQSIAAARQQNETLLGRLGREREQHREMYERQARAVRIHTDRADAAARENERLKEAIGIDPHPQSLDRLTVEEAVANPYVMLKAFKQGVGRTTAEIIAVRRENERLRAALGNWECGTCGGPLSDPEWEYDGDVPCDFCVEARAALKGLTEAELRFALAAEPREHPHCGSCDGHGGFVDQQGNADECVDCRGSGLAAEPREPEGEAK